MWDLGAKSAVNSLNCTAEFQVLGVVLADCVSEILVKFTRKTPSQGTCLQSGVSKRHRSSGVSASLVAGRRLLCSSGERTTVVKKRKGHTNHKTSLCCSKDDARIARRLAPPLTYHGQLRALFFVFEKSWTKFVTNCRQQNANSSFGSLQRF